MFECAILRQQPCGLGRHVVIDVRRRCDRPLTATGYESMRVDTALHGHTRSPTSRASAGPVASISVAKGVHIRTRSWWRHEGGAVASWGRARVVTPVSGLQPTAYTPCAAAE